ncbi:neutral zinc metallopeptidase [Mycolicibacterium fallax]|jgi:predicted metalloprotease|uniref:neutral zinc metallopeptidase n=2 Tax=Mycolicibacterium fallax TaxID=1793 RepID=UPI00138D6B7D|nr:neutral zinc metallopeptidase [Mycolicibacterium fallax]BBY99371.1 hypothetical protein MFAL_28380 [Mycolicibacterium fallax]HOW95809.1 neutral zinc metallopeptidase [Mycolicibacterium fallax]
MSYMDPFGPAPRTGMAGKRRPSAADPWAAADPFQVPAAPGVGAPPRRGRTGSVPVFSGGYHPQPPAANPWGGTAGGWADPAPVRADPWAADAFQVPQASGVGAPPRRGNTGAVPTMWPGAGQYQPGYPGVPVPPAKRVRVPLLAGIAAGVVVALVIAGGVVVAMRQGGPAAPIAGGPTTTATTAPTTTASSTGMTLENPSPTGPAPVLVTTPTGEAALSRNPLFATSEAGLPKQPCNPVGLPKDTATAQAFYAVVQQCLENGWRPLITGAQLDYRPPEVMVANSTAMSSPCGAAEGIWVAFYCSTNEMVYMPLDVMSSTPGNDEPLMYVSVFAHEFGHHVQALSGVTGESWPRRKYAGENTAAGLEISRRGELQAQCFSGMFVGSITDSGGIFTRAEFDDRTYGEARLENGYRDHGTPQHQQAWWLHGAERNQLRDCNTWAASPDAVE